MFSGKTLNMREDERISAVTAEQNRRGNARSPSER
jgi:hypothetical protein